MASDVSTVIARVLAAAGSDTVFGLPGGGNNLDLIGAVESAGLRFVLAHAETPAALMAAVYGDLTGTPSVCVVTRGPGTASAVNGVANALLDRQPLLVITDAVSAADTPRVAHQRLDQRALLAPATKWSATIGSGDAAATARHAVVTAMAYPRGPVHLDFDPTADSSTPPSSQHVLDAAGPSPADIEALIGLLGASERPIILLGMGSRHAVEAVRGFVAGSGAPVLTTYRAKGVFPESDPMHAGLLTGATTESAILAAADLIVTIGLDTVELIPAAWPYAAPIISVAQWPESSSYFVPRVELIGDVGKLLSQLGQHWPTSRWTPDAGRSHSLAEANTMAAIASTARTGVDPQAVVRQTRAVAPAGTIATIDAGAHMLPAMALWTVDEPDEALISSGLATMGFALPAAIAAALARPGRRVVAFTGDGGLGMCLGELETLARLAVPVTVVVFNDARLSLIAIKAKPEGNGGENAIAYSPIDFAAVAAGYGMFAARAGSSEELDAALTQCLAHDGASLLDVRVNPSSYPQILAAIRGQRPQETTPES